MCFTMGTVYHSTAQYIYIIKHKSVSMLRYLLLVGEHDKKHVEPAALEGLWCDPRPRSWPSLSSYSLGLGTLLAPVSQQIQISGEA